jgi:hypothetical protein
MKTRYALFKVCMFNIVLTGGFCSKVDAINFSSDILNERPDSSFSKEKGEEKGIGMSVSQSEPEFPGGQDSLSSFLFKNLHQPEKLTPKGKWKHEYVGFKVEKTGKITNPKVLLSLGDKMDAEALRIVSIMPEWKPATIAGNAVDKEYILSIDFFIPEKE